MKEKPVAIMPIIYEEDAKRFYETFKDAKFPRRTKEKGWRNY